MVELEWTHKDVDFGLDLRWYLGFQGQDLGQAVGQQQIEIAEVRGTLQQPLFTSGGVLPKLQLLARPHSLEDSIHQSTYQVLLSEDKATVTTKSDKGYLPKGSFGCTT